MEQLAPGDRRSALHLGTLVCFGFPGGQVCGLATKSRPSGGVCSHSIIDLQKEVEASCGALGLLGFRWGRNRRGGVCPGGDTSCFPAVLPRSSSRAGRTTCRSATSLGWAQPPTVATPPMARALRATRWRTTGSSSGEAPGALFRAPEAVLQLSHVGPAAGALPMAGGVCRCPFHTQTSDQPRACHSGMGSIPKGHGQSEMMAEVGGPRGTPEATAVVSSVSPSSLPSSPSTL